MIEKNFYLIEIKTKQFYLIQINENKIKKIFVDNNNLRLLNIIKMNYNPILKRKKNNKILKNKFLWKNK